VSFGGRVLGQTDDRGVVLLAMHGSEGDRAELLVRCPAGFLSPSKPLDVLLHRLAAPNVRAEYEIRCPPVRRELVVVVRAEHGPNLPVMVLGREVARTDGSGVAHALLEVSAYDQVEMTLRTDEPGAERLRPQNPVMKFTSADRDDMKLFDVRFEIEPAKRRGLATHALPVRLH
jgi:hypothetical protein